MAVCKLSYGEACQTQTQKGFQIKSSMCLRMCALSTLYENMTQLQQLSAKVNERDKNISPSLSLIITS